MLLIIVIVIICTLRSRMYLKPRRTKKYTGDYKDKLDDTDIEVHRQIRNAKMHGSANSSGVS